MTARAFRIGTRGSALARAQATAVREALANAGRETALTIIETEGDRRAPDTAWGEGAFVAAIEGALLDGRVDVAVHSAKDVPTDEDPRLRTAAYLPRADARDALVLRAGETARGLLDLPRGARIGTDSPRRTGFVRAVRPDLSVHPLHGNVDTRLRRLDAGETDALVLACAGLDRLGMSDRITHRIDPGIVPPAPGQGAIAVQVRSDDEELLDVCSTIDHMPTRRAVEAERAFLAASGGGCRAPLGAFATMDDETLELLGGHARVDGTAVELARATGPAAEHVALGRRLANELRRTTKLPRVLVTRAAAQVEPLLAAMRDAGLDPLSVPCIEIEPAAPGSAIDRATRHAADYQWVAVTSAPGAQGVLDSLRRAGAEPGRPCWAAIGEATRAVLEHAAIDVAFVPSKPTSAALAAELPVAVGDAVLLPRSDLADGDLPAALRKRGARVHDVVAYRTREAPEGSRRLLREALAGGQVAAIVFTSGSTVRGLQALARHEGLDVSGIPAVCAGHETSDAALAAGFDILAISPSPMPAALAATTADALRAHSREETS